jgi:hypothetical protein
MITEPLHVAIVNGKQLRFFRSPNNDGRPDLPWHSTDDLQSVFGLNPAQCGIMTTMWWNGPFEYVFHTIETSDEPMTIAPHCVALAAISSLVELIGIGFAEDIERAYSIGWTDACKKLHGDLRGARLQMWILAAFDRYDEYDVPDSTLDSFASRARNSLRKFTLQC